MILFNKKIIVSPLTTHIKVKNISKIITRKDYLDDRIAERLAPNDPQATDEKDFLNSLLTDELGEESLEGTATEEMMNEIKERFPDSTDKQILDELKKYIAVEDPFESLNLKKPKKRF